MIASKKNRFFLTIGVGILLVNSVTLANFSENRGELLAARASYKEVTKAEIE